MEFSGFQGRSAFMVDVGRRAGAKRLRLSGELERDRERIRHGAASGTARRRD
jgi:hypothetical protein